MMAQIRRNVIYNVYMFRPQRIVDPSQSEATAAEKTQEQPEPEPATA